MYDLYGVSNAYLNVWQILNAKLQNVGCLPLSFNIIHHYWQWRANYGAMCAINFPTLRPQGAAIYREHKRTIVVWSLQNNKSQHFATTFLN